MFTGLFQVVSGFQVTRGLVWSFVAILSELGAVGRDRSPRFFVRWPPSVIPTKCDFVLFGTMAPWRSGCDVNSYYDRGRSKVEVASSLLVGFLGGRYKFL